MKIYKPHYACFKCRKTFKRKLSYDIGLENGDIKQAECPDCGELMADMGLDFASPKKNDVKKWQHIKTLYSMGIVFYSCGCSGPGYIPKDKEQLRAYFKELLDEYNKQLAFWRDRHEPSSKQEIERERTKHWDKMSQLPSGIRLEKGVIKSEVVKKYWLEKINEIERKLSKLKGKN